VKLSKNYEPNQYEPNIYALWEAGGAFNPSGTGPTFSTIMPPPNANGNLHLGHALDMGLKDILVRYKRMTGHDTIYIPGADHAGFETWVVYERELQKKGQSRFDFSREQLYSQVWDFVDGQRGNMELQVRALGISASWKDLVFTLDILIDRMKREFNVEANIGEPQVAYRETIRGMAEAQGKHAKQSGGRGQFGDVWIRFEPTETGEGFEWGDEIKGGVVPQEYRKAVEKGIKDTLDGGVIAGFPMIGVKATLYDGSYHDVDSSELAFNLAGVLAVKEGIPKARPVILEPVMKVEVSTPEDFMGDIIGDLNSRRGRIDAMDDIPGGAKLVRAFVPLASLFGYTNDIRSLSQGRAASTMEIAQYEEVPPNVAQEIIEKRTAK
jgi:hypothetical protein